MKISKLTSLFLLVACSVLWLGNKDGRAGGGNEGATGAPNDNPTNRTCQNCHNNSSAIQVTLDIELYNEDQQLVSAYVPGEVYVVKVVVNSVGNVTPSAYGFQMVALDENFGPVNAWFNPGAGIHTVTLPNGRAYAEHLAPSPENIFEVSWTAPPEGTGDVTFYSCGNGVNGNNQTSGDGAAKTTLTVSESGTVSAVDVANLDPEVKLFPNPVSEELFLDLPEGLAGSTVISIYTLTGKEIRRNAMQTFANDRVSMDVSDLSEGLYLIRIETAEFSLSKQFVKL